MINYDRQDVDSNYIQVCDFMPSNTFRMLLCGPSGCGKTNTLINMIRRLLYFDKIYLYGKNLEQKNIGTHSKPSDLSQKNVVILS